MINLVPVNPVMAPDIASAVQESLDRLQPWMPWASPAYTEETAMQWICTTACNGHEFCILDPMGRYLGNVGVNQVNHEEKRANLGYWVRSSASGRGIATAAVIELVSWVRLNTSLNRLEIVAGINNLGSRRVAEKAGAEFEGIASARLLLHDRFHDAAIYSFTQ